MTQTDINLPTEGELQKAKQAIAGPVPLVPESPDTAVSLARGLLVMFWVVEV